MKRRKEALALLVIIERGREERRTVRHLIEALCSQDASEKFIRYGLSSLNVTGLNKCRTVEAM